MDPTRPHYLKCEEAAQLLGISAWTLRHWVCERKITFVRKGRLVRFRLDDLERFMNNGVVRANAAAGAEK
jgi:excisionase family DNA binding protein